MGHAKINRMIAALEAFKRGETIQYRSRQKSLIGRRGWIDVELKTPSWNFATYEYRAKPKGKS